jgi:hypothetical protein
MGYRKPHGSMMTGEIKFPARQFFYALVEVRSSYSELEYNRKLYADRAESAEQEIKKLRIEILRWNESRDLFVSKAEHSCLEIERLKQELYEAESAVWRIFPNVHTIGEFSDPFEGPGETYKDAYFREKLRADNAEAKIQELNLAYNKAIEDAAKAIEEKNRNNLGMIHPSTVSDAATIRTLKK